MKRIIVEDLSKKFFLEGVKRQGVLQRILFFLFNRSFKEISVVKDISFDITSGEILGIIGKNGAGKTTLLRLISGIYKKNSGKIYSMGKILPIIELYMTLNSRLSMKDNIYLIGSLAGMSSNEINKKYRSIVEFSELREFEDVKIYQFSEGMKQKLAFSIAIHTNSDIYLLDEVFEIGDEEFKEKSVKALRKIVKNGGCIILVSHDLNLVKKYCSRFLWLENGEIKKMGGKEVVEEYEKAGR